MTIENIGWTLGNECPYRCTHCYSMSARRKGADLEPWMIDRIVSELARLGVKTVNLGGNEPIFTNGIKIADTLLPYIVESLVDAGIVVGLTTSGITLLKLEQLFPHVVDLLNDIDVSLDSPNPEEHNRNRGASLYGQACKALDLCTAHDIDHTIIMCAMAWNFTPSHVDKVIEIAREHHAHVRINPLKPVQREHMAIAAERADVLRGLLEAHERLRSGRPRRAAARDRRRAPRQGLPVRAHELPDPLDHAGRQGAGVAVRLPARLQGRQPPDRRHLRHRRARRSSGRSGGATATRRRSPGATGCEVIETCRGGCAARSYLHHLHEDGERSLFVKDPYCIVEARAEMGDEFPPFPQKPKLPEDKIMVHRDYLCTWIGEPKGAGVTLARPLPPARPAFAPELGPNAEYMLRFRYLDDGEDARSTSSAASP